MRGSSWGEEGRWREGYLNWIGRRVKWVRVELRVRMGLVG